MEELTVCTTFFHQNRVYIGGNPYPLGQTVVDVFNLDETILEDLEKRSLAMVKPIMEFLEHPTRTKANLAQEAYNAAMEIVYELPLYRDVILEEYRDDRMFSRMVRNPEQLEQLRNRDEKLLLPIYTWMEEVLGLPCQLRSFREGIRPLIDRGLETLEHRNPDEYGMAFAEFNTAMLRVIQSKGLDAEWGQNIPAEINFVPMEKTPGSGKVMIAEKISFRRTIHFLVTELYRGLMIGNAPRRCHNCGRYFLLTEGYDICYCNNIAPGETERTCRTVGAHRKEAQGKVHQTPGQRIYERVYNRLKQRKKRKKITEKQWNELVAKAQRLRDKYEQGKLTDEEYERLMNEI